MSHDEFTKLFTYMQANFTELRKEMDDRFRNVDKKFDQIYGLLDAHIKWRETDEQERLAMASQLDRHEAWITQLAKHANLKPRA